MTDKRQTIQELQAEMLSKMQMLQLNPDKLEISVLQQQISATTKEYSDKMKLEGELMKKDALEKSMAREIERQEKIKKSNEERAAKDQERKEKLEKDQADRDEKAAKQKQEKEDREAKLKNDKQDRESKLAKEKEERESKLKKQQEENASKLQEKKEVQAIKQEQKKQEVLTSPVKTDVTTTVKSTRYRGKINPYCPLDLHYIAGLVEDNRETQREITATKMKAGLSKYIGEDDPSFSVLAEAILGYLLSTRYVFDWDETLKSAWQDYHRKNYNSTKVDPGAIKFLYDIDPKWRTPEPWQSEGAFQWSAFTKIDPNGGIDPLTEYRGGEVCGIKIGPQFTKFNNFTNAWGQNIGATKFPNVSFSFEKSFEETSSWVKSKQCTDQPLIQEIFHCTFHHYFLGRNNNPNQAGRFKAAAMKAKGEDQSLTGGVTSGIATGGLVGGIQGGIKGVFMGILKK